MSSTLYSQTSAANLTDCYNQADALLTSIVQLEYLYVWFNSSTVTIGAGQPDASGPGTCVIQVRSQTWCAPTRE